MAMKQSPLLSSIHINTDHSLDYILPLLHASFFTKKKGKRKLILLTFL